MRERQFKIDVLERKYSKCSSLKFNSSKIVKPKTVKAFIKKIFDYNNIYHTVNAETNKHQCNRGRSRSLGDLFRITKHYYPEITFAEFLVKASPYLFYDNDKISSSFCFDINRRIYFKSGTNRFFNNRSFYEDLPDENGLTIYSLRQGVEELNKQMSKKL